MNGVFYIAKQSIKRFKDKIRAITRRNRGIALRKVIEEINKLTPGWVRYFKKAQCKRVLEDLDGWIRRKLRCIKLKHCKRAYAIAKFLKSRGIKPCFAWKMAKSGKGWWRLALTPQAHEAMGVAWAQEQGLKSLRGIYLSL